MTQASARAGAGAAGGSEAAVTRKTSEWCRAHFLNYRNLCKVDKIYAQLRGMLVRLGLDMMSSNALATGSEFDPIVHTEPVKKALLLGLFTKVARKQPHDSSYLTLADSQVVHIHPSSVLISRSQAARPPLVVYTELVQTTRSYMRDCMELDELKWLVELVPECYAGGVDAKGEDGIAAQPAATSTTIKGGKAQQELHQRLASTNANRSKLSGGAGAAAAAAAAAAVTAAEARAAARKAELVAAAAASGKSIKQLKKERAAAAATAAAAARLAAPAPRLPQPKDDTHGSQKKQKRAKESKSSSSLLDFVNTL